MNLDKNKEVWDRTYAWKMQGDEWSARWGGPEMQWHGTLLPRLHAFLPAGRIVEIATGFGRWTQFLLPQCRAFVGIDLAAKCIEHCRRRFAAAEHAAFSVTDGVSIPVEDASADLVFSFDSLVHVDFATMAAYLREVRRVLSPQGVAFLHHSNLAGIDPPLLVPPDKNQRDGTVSAEAVAREAETCGLCCAGQERITWDRPAPYFIDCISLLTLPRSQWARANKVIETDISIECSTAQRMGGVYVRKSFAPAPKSQTAG